MGGNLAKGGASFLESLPGAQSPHHIVMVGLDSAGKTTALYRLKLDSYLNTVPTIGFNCERVRGSKGKSKGVNFTVWDVGGQEKLRPLWKSYTRHTDGIIFVLDSLDEERFEEAKVELIRTVRSNDNLGVPLLLFANKQDLPGSKEPHDIETILQLRETLHNTLYHVQPACAITGDGLDDGIEVLYEMILKRRKLKKQRKK